MFAFDAVGFCKYLPPPILASCLGPKHDQAVSREFGGVVASEAWEEEVWSGIVFRDSIFSL